jgi:signal transduction histidine kinase
MRRWRRVLAFQAALSGLVAFAMTALWGVTGGGTFWPKWVWYGLAIPFGLNAALYGAFHVRRRRWRIFTIHAALFAWVSATLILTWAMAGSDQFWPLIPIVCLSMLLGVHAIVAGMTGGDPELVERVDELTRTRRGALDVQEHELRRIERDLHDGAQARLVALTMQLGRAEARLNDNPEAAELIREARGEAKEAIAELRDLARGIAPPILADRGLAAAAEAVAGRSAIRASVDSKIGRRPPPVVETAAYFVITESLTNAAKHAGPDARAHVSIRDGSDELTLEITDDGRGGANPAGSGLTGLRHRVEALDGELTVISAEGHGTIVRAVLPY